MLPLTYTCTLSWLFCTAAHLLKRLDIEPDYLASRVGFENGYLIETKVLRVVGCERRYDFRSGRYANWLFDGNINILPIRCWPTGREDKLAVL